MAKKIKVDPTEVASLVNGLLVCARMIDDEIFKAPKSSKVREMMGWYNRDADALIAILGPNTVVKYE